MNSAGCTTEVPRIAELIPIHTHTNTPPVIRISGIVEEAHEKWAGPGINTISTVFWGKECCKTRIKEAEFEI